MRSRAYSVKMKDMTEVEFAETFLMTANAPPELRGLYTANGPAGKAVICYAIDNEQQSEYRILQGSRFQAINSCFQPFVIPLRITSSGRLIGGTL